MTNSDDTHIYYDISVFNNDTTGAMPVNLTFNEQRSGGALIDNPQDYYFSIVRFELDSPHVPLFIPEHRAGSTNNLIYTFVIEVFEWKAQAVVNTVSVPAHEISRGKYKAHVQYIPTNPNLPPPDNTTENHFTDEYYYVYNFKRWVAMVNTCLSNLFGTIPNTQKNSTITVAPTLRLREGIGLLGFYTSVDFLPFASTPAPADGTFRYNLYWNAPTETIFAGFDTTRCPTALANVIDDTSPVESSTHTSAYYQLHITNPISVNNEEVNGVNYVFTLQDYPSLPMCSPIQNIVFSTSGHLPVSNSQTGSPVLFTSDGACTTQGGTDNISPVLTDFIVPLTTGSEYKPKINYSPSVYRLLDMKGNAPLKTCDLQVYWKSKIDAKLHPLVLGSQCGASLKIMFRKKQFNNIF